MIIESYLNLRKFSILLSKGQSAVFGDALIHAAIRDLGGWSKQCMTKNESLPFLGQEFQNRYRWFVNQKPACHPSHLIGITESQNSQAGFIFAPPVLFGD